MRPKMTFASLLFVLLAPFGSTRADSHPTDFWEEATMVLISSSLKAAPNPQHLLPSAYVPERDAALTG